MSLVVRSGFFLFTLTVVASTHAQTNFDPDETRAHIERSQKPATPPPPPPAAPAPGVGEPTHENDGVADMSATGFLNFGVDQRAGREAGSASAAKHLAAAQANLLRLLAFTMVCSQNKGRKGEASTKLYYIKEAFKGYRDELMANVGKDGALLQIPRQEYFLRDLKDVIRGYKNGEGAEVLEGAASAEPFLGALSEAAEAVTRVSIAKTREPDFSLRQETRKSAGIDATMKGDRHFAKLSIFDKAENSRLDPGAAFRRIANAAECRGKNYASMRSETRLKAGLTADDRKAVTAAGQRAYADTQEAAQAGARDYRAMVDLEEKIRKGSLREDERVRAQILVTQIQNRFSDASSSPKAGGYLAGFGENWNPAHLNTGDQVSVEHMNRLATLEAQLKAPPVHGPPPSPVHGPELPPTTEEAPPVAPPPPPPPPTPSVREPDPKRESASGPVDPDLFAKTLPSGGFVKDPKTQRKLFDEWKFEEHVRQHKLNAEQAAKLRAELKKHF